MKCLSYRPSSILALNKEIFAFNLGSLWLLSNKATWQYPRPWIDSKKKLYLHLMAHKHNKKRAI